MMVEVFAFFLVLVACVEAGGFSCKDKSPDCPNWMRNMGGTCRGVVDEKYMLHNCPKTCGMCDEARQLWNEQEAERRKSPTYEPDDSRVIVLDRDTIDDFLEEEADSLVLLEFYAPWCGHCQHVAPSFREAARVLAKESEAGRLPVPVKLAKMDSEDPFNQPYNAGSESKYNFSSYPSMFLHGGTQKFNKDRYAGGREAEEIVHFMTSLAEGKDQEAAWYAWHDVEKGMRPGFYKDGGKHASHHVQELDPDNFAEVVLRSDKVWIVEFYSDKCPICNSLAPDIIKAAEKLQAEFPDKLKFGACNSRVWSEEIAEPFGVTSYPWIASFYLGKKTEDMAGLGGWESVVKWGQKKVKDWKAGNSAKTDSSLPPPKARDEL